ncbi:MAG: dTDP-4-dehydrorhamnose 3,5-epimerase family protein [bacterium]
MTQLNQFKSNKKILIENVKISQLKPVIDERGFLTEMMRSDDPDYKGFGQTYITSVNENVVKAWHYHEKQTDTFICVYGMIKLVLYDYRKESTTYGIVNEFFIGEKNSLRVQIPTRVMHGFKGISPVFSLVINMPDQLYNYENPDEFRVHPHENDIPYDWSRKDG